MASLLAKLLASNPLTTKPAILFRPLMPATCSFLTTSTTSLKCKLKLTDDGGCTSEVPDVFNNDVCPRLPATSNLVHLLNSMDNRIRFRPALSRYPRWDVIEDAEALYLVRDLSGVPKSVHVEKFSDYTPGNIYTSKRAPLNVFGCVRVHRISQAIEITVGVRGPDPGTSINGIYYQGYLSKIDLPATLYKVSNVVMDVNNEILKITIPKEEGKWIDNINVELIFHTFTGRW